MKRIKKASRGRHNVHKNSSAKTQRLAIGIVGALVMALTGIGIASSLQTSLLAQTGTQETTPTATPTPTASSSACGDGADCGTQDRSRERQDLERVIKDKERTMSDWQKEIKNCKKDVPTLNYAGLDAAPLDGEKFFQQMKDLLAGQPAGNLTSEFNTNDFWDLNRDFDDVNQTFWDNIQTCNIERDKTNVSKNLQNRDRELNKDIERQIKDLTKDGIVLEGSTLLQKKTECAGYINQLKTLLTQPIEDSRDLWDAQKDVDDCFQDLYLELRDLQDIQNEKREVENNEQQLKDVARNMKDKRRMIEKDMAREISRLKKQNLPAADAEACVANLQKSLQEMQAAYDAKDPQTAWDFNRDIDALQQDCWETIQKNQQAQEFTQRIKDRTREIADRKREIQQMAKELIRSGEEDESELNEAEEVLKQMETIVEQIKALVAEGNYDEARNADDVDFQDLRMQWQDAMPQFRALQEMKFVNRDLENASREIGDIKNRLDQIEQEGGAPGDSIAACRKFITEIAEPSIQEAASKITSQDTKWFEENGARLEKLGLIGDRACGFAIEGGRGFNRPDIQGFVQQDFEGLEKELMQRVMEKVTQDITRQVMEKVTAMQSSLVDELLAKAGDKFADAAARVLEATSFVPEQYQNELVEKKTAMLSRMEELEKMEQELQLKHIALKKETEYLENLKQQISVYNWTGSYGDEMEDKVAQFTEEAPNLSREELQRKMDALKADADHAIEANRQEKFSQGIIPFRDTDDHEWYTKYVFTVKERGAIKGYLAPDGSPTGEFRPGNNLTNLEWIKIVLELTGHGEQAQNLGGWPEGYWQEAKNAGISIALQNADKNGPISRAEMLRVLFQATGQRPESAQGCAFSDACGHPLKDYIELGTVEGFIQGNPDGTFAPDRQLNRAEASKIASRLAEVMK